MQRRGLITNDNSVKTECDGPCYANICKQILNDLKPPQSYSEMDDSMTFNDYSTLATNYSAGKTKFIEVQTYSSQPQFVIFIYPLEIKHGTYIWRFKLHK
jgi:hypothetical protein